MVPIGAGNEILELQLLLPFSLGQITVLSSGPGYVYFD
jgi:hypothetical protein